MPEFLVILVKSSLQKCYVHLDFDVTVPPLTQIYYKTCHGCQPTMITRLNCADFHLSRISFVCCNRCHYDQYSITHCTLSDASCRHVLVMDRLIIPVKSAFLWVISSILCSCLMKETPLVVGIRKFEWWQKANNFLWNCDAFAYSWNNDHARTITFTNVTGNFAVLMAKRSWNRMYCRYENTSNQTFCKSLLGCQVEKTGSEGQFACIVNSIKYWTVLAWRIREGLL